MNKSNENNIEPTSRQGLSRKGAILILLSILLAMIASHLIWHLLPRSQGEIEKCQAIVEHRHIEKVFIGDSLLFVDVDTTINYGAVWVNRYQLLPSCRGRLLVENPGGRVETNKTKTKKNYQSDAEKVLNRKVEHLKTSIERQEKDLRETRYYLRSHGVQDEGFMIVAEHDEQEKLKNNVDKQLLTTLTNIKNTENVSIKAEDSFFVVYRDNNDRVVRERCKPTNLHFENKQMFVTYDKTKPLGIRPKYYKTSEVLTPRLSLTDSLNLLSVRLTRANVGNIFLPMRISGIMIDSLNRKIIGQYVADTLYEGIRYDSKGCYYGQMTANGVASGHGKYVEKDESFYEGHWDRDARSGFGIECRHGFSLKGGEWNNNLFKGERLNYTSDRIYGIDIARYQHEIGKKIYPINWQDLRIVHLGTISKKRISGKVDYPVSFVYIKSTEGTTVFNKYYSADYSNAKRHEKVVGTYHFFSTKSSGKAQAEYFLRCSRINKGDLPPVLDVEPTHSQIMAMGGVDVMFKHIRTWMSIVEKAIGCKPILYISQSFVNRYLNDAPDIKKRYKVWIARYGEYKPDVHLVYWQLCPDGRVNGIHGDVDINVFNGYQATYEHFLQESRVP